MVEDRLDHLGRVVDDLDQVDVAVGDEPVAEQLRAPALVASARPG